MQMVSRLAFVLVVLTALQLLAADSGKPEQKFTAMLIWGTDGDKPTEKEKDLKDVDPALKEKFSKIFKWKNYFEVTRTNVAVKAGEHKQIDLSKKCQVKIHQTDKEGMDVELIGDGKSVYKGNRSMPLKDIFILAGDDKNATAWFVVLKPE